MEKGEKLNMDIFEYAIQMETDGEAFYRELAGQCENKGMRNIFNMLADDEVKHYHTLEKVRKEMPEMPRTTILSDAKNIFAQMREENQIFPLDIPQVELYRKAQEIEMKSEAFYREKADESGDDRLKNLLLKIADEERKHYFLLDNIIEFVTKPDRWIESAEFYHLEEF